MQARTFVVDNQNSRANDTGDATVAQPFKTINAAARLAQAGDEIVVQAGVYRETIVPARGGEAGKPIVYRAAEPGRVVVKATEVWKPNWKKVAGRADVYRAVLPVALLTRFNPFVLPTKTFEGTISRGQIFYQGRPLAEILKEKSFVQGEMAWRTVNGGTSVELHTPDGVPRELEISTRDALFRPQLRGLGYITLRDFVFEGGANARATRFWEAGQNPQAGVVSTRTGHHWTLENNVIRYAKTLGLDCGSEQLGRVINGQPASPDAGYHLIRGNTVSDNGQAGIYGSRQIGSRFENNVIARNNTLHFFTYEEAGMKCHEFINCVVEGNLFLDNEAKGLWLDNVWAGTRLSNNAFINNRASGLFLEMGRGPCLVENNIIGWTRLDFKPKNPSGNGFYAHDASGFTVRNNIIVNNATFGVNLRTVTIRPFSIYPPDMVAFNQPRLRYEIVSTSDITVQNNVIAGNQSGITNLRFDKDVSGNVSDNNLLGAPLTFELNSFAKSKNPAPPELVGVPLDWQKWQELTGHDKASKPIEIKSELIRGARPIIRLEVDQPLPAAIMEIAKTEGLPYELQITTSNAR